MKLENIALESFIKFHNEKGSEQVEAYFVYEGIYPGGIDKFTEEIFTRILLY